MTHGNRWPAEDRPASRFDPDPLYVEPEELEPVGDSTRPSGLARGIVFALLIEVTLAFLVAAILILLVGSSIAAPRSATNPTTTVPRDVSGLLGGASGPSLTGAPHGEAIPRTRGIEPATMSDPAHQAAGGAPRAEIGSVLLGGYATWFDVGPGLYGAAGPTLREVLGDWRGQRVTVCADACVTVRLTDSCACGDRAGEATLIDLSPAAFRELAPLSAGVVAVSIEIGGSPRLTLPPTDSDG